MKEAQISQPAWRENTAVSRSPTQPVEFSGMQVLADGEGFLLECRDRDQQLLRLQFPSWALHQLMRTLPRVEAAMQQARSGLSSAIVAHPVVSWSVERSGVDRDVAVCMRTDQHVESAFLFDIDSAKAFRRALDEAIERAVESPLIRRVVSTTN